VDVDEVFALGPATIDPRTGEILHSAIGEHLTSSPLSPEG